MVLSHRQKDVLEALACFGGHERTWARPMDIGARDGSNHTQTLRALIKKGMVERHLRGTLINSLRGQDCYDQWSRVKRGRHAPRGSYVYRLTRKGWKVIRG